ncbi:MAG: YidC/Oxa1 family membrane protein insertase [bacterium]
MLTTAPRKLRILIIALLSLSLLLLIAGCGGGGAAIPLDDTQLDAVRTEMEKIEQTSSEDLLAQRDKLVIKSSLSADTAQRAHDSYLLGYITEYLATKDGSSDEKLVSYPIAYQKYLDAEAQRAPISIIATYRIAVLGEAGKIGTDAKDSALKSKKAYEVLRNHYKTNSGDFFGSFKPKIGLETIVRIDKAAPIATPLPGKKAHIVSTLAGVGTPEFIKHSMPDLALHELDTLYVSAGGYDALYYKVVDSIVNALKVVSPTYAAVWMLIILALLVKLVTLPLTTISFRSMRDMQKLQPLIKELQEKYKDDKTKFGEEQMKLMSEHKVSPLGGCLPMLVQIPVFFIVYRAVQVYSAKFDVGFMWIPSLSMPDMILLGLYLASMIVTQKLTAQPSTDPQQQAMQTQMTYLMPIMLAFVLASTPSAFILYWFFLNVFSSAHQYYLMKSFDKADLAKAGAAGVIIDAPKSITAAKNNNKRSTGQGTKKGNK